MIRPFLVAVQFLTVLPVRLGAAPQETEIAASLPFYPVVGLLLGLLLAALAEAFVLAGFPDTLAAALLLAFWVGVTGGLHLDGLADSADAWVGGRGSRERTLAIMKDPYCGPAAVVTLIVALLLKFTALETLLAEGRVLECVLPPLLGRAALPLLFWCSPYVRPGGLGAALATGSKRPAALFSMICALAAGGFWGWTGMLVLLSGVLCFVWLRRLMLARIGGVTGDTAGAMVELIELVAVVTLASFR